MSLQLGLYDPLKTYEDQSKFDCGNETINKFVKSSLKQQVKKRLSVAYALTDSAHKDRFVGFFTLAQHSIPLSLLTVFQVGSLPSTVPCSRLIMLGVRKDYQGQQLGSRLMKHALKLTKQVGETLGSFGLYLDADQDAVTFYAGLGFVLLDGRKDPAPSPMFLKIEAMP